jgi:hemin uptake protein HemP
MAQDKSFADTQPQAACPTAMPPVLPPVLPDPMPAPQPRALPAARADAANRRWRSAELFGQAAEVEIEHGQAVYRLRRTSLGKLILTK